MISLEHGNLRKKSTDDDLEDLESQSRGPNIACSTAKIPASNFARIV